MRYASKEALLHDVQTEHDALCTLVGRLPDERWQERGVWGNGWTLADLFAHLAEWQEMFLRWYEDGLRGVSPQMPAPGYKWNETPKLNRAIWKRHRLRGRRAIMADFDAGYRRILRLAEVLAPQKIMAPGHFAWTGRHPLATYLAPNTASHYRFARKVIHRWLRTRGAAGRAR